MSSEPTNPYSGGGMYPQDFPSAGSKGDGVTLDFVTKTPFEPGKKYFVLATGALCYKKCEYISNNGRLYWFKKSDGKIVALSGDFLVEEE